MGRVVATPLVGPVGCNVAVSGRLDVPPVALTGVDVGTLRNMGGGLSIGVTAYPLEEVDRGRGAGTEMVCSL
jgi:hypothetical protein